MNLLKTAILFSVSLCLIQEIHAQNRVSILPASRIFSKNTLLTFIEMDFHNEGEFIQDSSTLLFASHLEKRDLHVFGEGEFFLHNLTVQLGGNSLIMESDINISNEVSLRNGSLDLNAHTLSLDEGDAQIRGEGGGNHILGEGIIEKHVNLIYPHKVNPGNLGIRISAEENLGQTVLKRIQQLEIEDSVALIHRQYEVHTSFVPKTPIQLNLTYLDTENPFGKEALLVPVEERGNSWSEMAYYQSAEKANTMDVLLAEAKNDWHIGLSPAKIRVKSRKNEVSINFQLYPNPFDGFVLLQWDKQDEIPVEFQLFDVRGSLVYGQKLVFHAQEILLEGIPSLPAGIYLVKILTDKGNTASGSLIHKK